MVKLNIKYAEFNDQGQAIRLIGTVRKTRFKHKINTRTQKIIFWATLHLDYIGG